MSYKYFPGGTMINIVKRTITSITDHALIKFELYTDKNIWYAVQNVNGGTRKNPYGFTDIKALKRLRADIDSIINEYEENHADYRY